MKLISETPAGVVDHAGAWLSVYAIRARDRFGIHEHPMHQLSWSPIGTLIAEVGDRLHRLPTTQALWIPGGHIHDVTCLDDLMLHNLHIDSSDCPSRCANRP